MRIKGVRVRMACIKRGRASPEEKAKNWKDTDQTHEAGKAGRNADAQSRDDVRIHPVS